MKIKDTWKAILASFGGEKTELSEDDVDKLNTELQTKTDKITQLTTELTTEKAARETAETSLATANETIKTHETTIEGLNVKLAQKPAGRGASPDNEGDRGAESETEAGKEIANLAHNKFAEEQLGNY